MPQQTTMLAKLSVPVVATAVRRERLLRRIDAAGSAVWIAAPPGTGKTTLAASYVGSAKRPALWYRIDAGDADPAAFFYFLGLAATKAAPRRRIVLPLLTPEYLPDLGGFTRRFFRTLFERLPAGSTLVFDNLHELDGVAAFHDIMREALSEIPTGFKVLIVSRTDPPRELARLAANRELELLGWSQLRLTPEETRVLAGAAVDAATAQRLHEQSGGWAAGVILLLRHAGDGETMGLRSPESVFNYFAGEIFGRASDAVRRLLIRTAFFPDFTLPMAERATDGGNVHEVLATLCRQHCFVDHADGSYHYHDLFRDFLRAQAGDEAPACRRAAAGVLSACGRTDEAIPLLLDNGDWPAAAGLILDQARTLVDQGRWQTLRGWIDALPHATTEAAPWLLYWLGVSNFVDNPTLGRLIIGRSFRRFADLDDTMGQLLAASAIIEANYHEYADFSVLDQWSEKMEALGGMHLAFPSLEIEMRVLTGMLCAFHMRQPASALGQVLADRLEPLLERDIDPNLKSSAATFLLWFAIWGGEFTQARRIHAWAGRLLAERRLTPLNDLMLRSVKGHGEIFLGDGVGAREVLDTAEDIGRRYGFTSARIGIILPMQVYRHLTFGDLAAAEALIAEAGKHSYSGPMNAAQIEFCRSWLALLRGKVALACEHARGATDLAHKSGSHIAKACCHTAWALALVERADAAAARRQLAAAQQVMQGRRSGVIAFHLLLAEAWLALRAGERARSADLLRQAFVQGAAQGYGSTMQWLPTMMAELCAEALRTNIEPDYARSLIARRGLRPPAADLDAWPWPLEVRTLGGFEVRRDDKPIAFAGKTPKRPIALLKALIAFGGPGQGVPEARLSDALWPDGDATADALAVAVHRLRKLLGEADAVQVQGGRIGLNPALCRVDAWAFEQAANRAAAAGPPEECLQHSRRVLALYRGNFLADDMEDVWMVPTRERLRTRFVHHVAATAQLLCERKECDQVVDSCRRGLDVDGLIESFYRQLMLCSHCRGHNAEGLAVYRCMQRTFSVVLGIAPSAASEALYRRLRGVA